MASPLLNAGPPAACLLGSLLYLCCPPHISKARGCDITGRGSSALVLLCDGLPKIGQVSADFTPRRQVCGRTVQQGCWGTLKYLGGSVKEMEIRSDSHSATLPCISGSY